MFVCLLSPGHSNLSSSVFAYRLVWLFPCLPGCLRAGLNFSLIRHMRHFLNHCLTNRLYWATKRKICKETAPGGLTHGSSSPMLAWFRAHAWDYCALAIVCLLQFAPQSLRARFYSVRFKTCFAKALQAASRLLVCAQVQLPIKFKKRECFAPSCRRFSFGMVLTSCGCHCKAAV